MATRKDVARRAGVSVATVSYVMNHTKHVTPEVQKRVEEAIQELNYTPNLVARSLVTRRTQHVAMFVDNLKNPYYTEVLAGAQSVASKKGYIVSLIMVDYANPGEELRLTARGIDGALVMTIHPEKMIRLLGEQIPSVTVGRCIELDYRRGVFEAVRSLKSHGHRQIACLSGIGLDPDSNVRYRYLLEALEQYHLPCDETLFVGGNAREETDEQAGADAMRELLERDRPFTAVFALNDLMAFGAMQQLHRQGLKIPEDVSVIGCDNTQPGRYFIPPLSTIDVSSFEMGRALMKELIAKVEKKPDPRKVIRSSYLERESVGDCKKRKQQPQRAE